MDDLTFLTSDNSINKIVTGLEKTGIIALQQGTSNLVTYNMSKTEAILFSNACRPKLARQIAETRLKIGREVVFFNKEAILWLRTWLDSRLNFASHVSERRQKAKWAEFMIKQLSKTHDLYSELLRRIQIAAVQSVALYRAELWWKGQKICKN